MDGSADRCRDTSSLPHVFNLASSPFFLASEGRIQKHMWIHQHHAFIFGGLKQVWNRSETMWQRQFMPTRPTNGPCERPTHDAKRSYPTRKLTVRKGLPRKSKGFHEIGHKHHGPECINIHHIIYLVPLRHDVRSNKKACVSLRHWWMAECKCVYIFLRYVYKNIHIYIISLSICK